jgi:hypothetical protein
MQWALSEGPQHGVRFTYPVVVADFSGGCAGRTLAKRCVLASIMARKAGSVVKEESGNISD